MKWNEEELQILADNCKVKIKNGVLTLANKIQSELMMAGYTRKIPEIRRQMAELYGIGNVFNAWYPEEEKIVQDIYSKYDEKKFFLIEIVRACQIELKKAGFERSENAIESYVRRKMKKQSKVKERRVTKDITNRPWAQDDVDLVHWFKNKGYTPRQIAREINRAEKDIKTMLTLKPRKIMKEDPISYYVSPQ